MKASDPRAWVWSWFEQLLLRRAPQDDVCSYTGLLAALAAYLLMDILLALTDWPAPAAFALSVMDVLVMVVFTGSVLALVRKYERLLQTLTALAGTGALLGVIGLPLVLLAATTAQPERPPLALAYAWLVLLGWQITVQAHIFRHALSARFGVGLLVAILHTVVMVALLETLFPRAAQTSGLQ